MKISVNSSVELPFISKELELLTNRAIINPFSIEYHNDAKTLNIPMKWRNIIGFKKGLFTLKPIYKEEDINSVLIVKKIKECNIVNRCNNSISKITLLFGVQIRAQEIYISSAEESLGNNVYELSLKVSEIDIDFYDLIEYKTKADN